MKAFLFIFIGGLIAGFLAFLVGSAISQYQVRVLLLAPDQTNEFIDIFLLTWPLSFFVGGWVGLRWSKRKPNQASKPTGPKKPGPAA